MKMKVKPRKMKDGYFCKKCENHHYSYGTIGIKHSEFKGLDKVK